MATESYLEGLYLEQARVVFISICQCNFEIEATLPNRVGLQILYENCSYGVWRGLRERTEWNQFNRTHRISVCHTSGAVISGFCRIYDCHTNFKFHIRTSRVVVSENASHSFIPPVQYFGSSCLPFPAQMYYPHALMLPVRWECKSFLV